MNKTLLLLLAIGLFFMACNTPSKNSDTEVKTTPISEKTTANQQADNQVKEETKPEVLKRSTVIDSTMLKRLEEAKKEKPNEEQKAIGVNICNCMNKHKIFSKISKAKSQEEFNKLAGDNAFEEVFAIQQCHSKFMKPAVKGMNLTEAGVFSYKARAYLENKCMHSNPQLWFYIGDYIAHHHPKNQNQ